MVYRVSPIYRRTGKVVDGMGSWYDVSYTVAYINGKIDDGEMGIYADSSEEASAKARAELEQHPYIKTVLSIASYGR